MFRGDRSDGRYLCQPALQRRSVPCLRDWGTATSAVGASTRSGSNLHYGEGFEAPGGDVWPIRESGTPVLEMKPRRLVAETASYVRNLRTTDSVVPGLGSVGRPSLIGFSFETLYTLRCTCAGWHPKISALRWAMPRLMSSWHGTPRGALREPICNQS